MSHDPSEGECIWWLIGFFILAIIFRRIFWPGQTGCGWFLIGYDRFPFWYLFDDQYFEGNFWSPPTWSRRGEKKRFSPPKTSPPVKANPDFKDEKLDSLIEDGKFREAKEYLTGMMKVANEMGDKQCKVNYSGYKKKISLAALRVDRAKSRGSHQHGRSTNSWIPHGFDLDARAKQDRERADNEYLEDENTE